ncbi:MAG: hypothetical protein JSS14_15000 [Proteobacteria bacterium]|nr:hypothetical protein [Pseudomonadota bacterium]
MTRAFFMAAFQVLGDEEIERIVAHMAGFGVVWNTSCRHPGRSRAIDRATKCPDLIFQAPANRRRMHRS